MIEFICSQNGHWNLISKLELKSAFINRNRRFFPLLSIEVFLVHSKGITLRLFSFFYIGRSLDSWIGTGSGSECSSRPQNSLGWKPLGSPQPRSWLRSGGIELREVVGQVRPSTNGNSWRPTWGKRWVGYSKTCPQHFCRDWQLLRSRDWLL